MATTKIIPIYALAVSMDQTEINAFAITMAGVSANKSVVFNSTIGKTQIWNGSAFENMALMNSDGTINVSNNITFFNQSGAIIVNKVMSFSVTPNTSNGYSISISQAGFTNVMGYSIIAVKNTGAATSSPNVSVKSVSTSAIVVNITEGSTNIVTLLSTSLLSGAPVVFADVTGLTLNVVVFGN